MIKFSKYEFNNKLLDGVALLKIAQSLSLSLSLYIYIYIYIRSKLIGGTYNLPSIMSLVPCQKDLDRIFSRWKYGIFQL